MTPARWQNTSAYLREVFGREDPFLAALPSRAAAAGLPPISISPDVGRLLSVLVRLAHPPAGARLAVELGTLAGYSGTWIARALAPGGRLITVESDPAHAAFARAAFDQGGIGARVDVRLGKALDVLPSLAAELAHAHGPAPLDFVFLDAVKHEYADYFRLLRPLIRPGGILVADNALGAGSWWIDEAAGEDNRRERDGIDRFSRLVAADEAFETACVPAREGVLIAVRTR